MSAAFDGIALAIAANHPAYDGHFPGRPILPGVALLNEVLGTLEQAAGFDPLTWTIPSAKFLRPVQPGEALVLRVAASARGSVRFEVHGPGGLVATGSVAPRIPGAAP